MACWASVRRTGPVVRAHGAGTDQHHVGETTQHAQKLSISGTRQRTGTASERGGAVGAEDHVGAHPGRGPGVERLEFGDAADGADPRGRAHRGRLMTATPGIGSRLGLMAGLQVVHVAEGYPVLQLIRWVAAHGSKRCPTWSPRVIVPRSGLPTNQAAGVVEYRCLSRAGVPSAVIETVDGVAGALAEQFHDVEVFAVERVHRQVGGVGGHPERVVALGQTDQEARRMDAGLAGEPDQAAAVTLAASVVMTNIG